MEADARIGSRATGVDAVTRRPRRGARFALVAIAVACLLTGLASVSLAGAGGTPPGSVQVSLNAPTTQVCTYTALIPGTLTGSATCSLATSYTGAMHAYISLTVALQAKAGRGGMTLYDGTNITGLTFTISDGHNSFTVPTGSGATGGSCPSGFTCWTSANDLAGWYSNGTPNVTFDKGDALTVTATPRFPRSAGNPYQGGSATLTLTIQAVQAPSNPLPATCGISTIGRPCPATGTFSWS